jgi:Fe-S cluster biogenesis protein NfuA
MADEKLEFNEENVRAEIEKIRPMLQADGGDIELVGLDGGIVKVRLKGSCSGCAFATMTLQFSVEKTLRHYFPDMEKVENVE